MNARTRTMIAGSIWHRDCPFDRPGVRILNAELAALLASAKETPDEDAPRLVIADWLDEHDEPARAELIRLQCHADYAAPCAAALRARADAILGEHAERWWGPSTAVVRVLATRGFPTVHIGLNSLHRQDISPPLRDAWQQGWVSSVALQGSSMPGLLSPLGIPHPRPDPWSRIAECPLLAGVAELSLSGHYFNDRHAEILASSPFLGSLVILTLGPCQLTPNGQRTLLDSPNLPLLARVDASSDGLSLADELRAAAVSGVLQVNGNWLLSAAVCQLLRGITDPIPEVRLTNPRPCWYGVTELLSVPGLQRLTLDHLTLDASTMQRIAEHAPPTLMHLDLSFGTVGNDAVKALAIAQQLAGLRLLDLAHCDRVYGKGVIALAESPHLAGLHALDLRGACLSPEAVSALLRPETFPRMRRLILSEEELSSRRRRHLLTRYGDALTLLPSKTDRSPSTLEGDGP